jgi:hypothetical protein
MPKITDLSRLFSPLNTPHDSIADFTPGIDTIDLSAIDANTHRNGNQKFHFEGIGPAHRGQGDTDGDGAYDVLIVLKGHHHLHAGRLHPLTLAGYGRRSPAPGPWTTRTGLRHRTLGVDDAEATKVAMSGLRPVLKNR